jgi:biopolymer transport protein ExbB/TolQ
MTFGFVLLSLFFFALLLWVARGLNNAQLDLNVLRGEQRQAKNLLERAMEAARTHAKRRELAESQRDAAEKDSPAQLEAAVLLEKKLALIEPIEATKATSSRPGSSTRRPSSRWCTPSSPTRTSWSTHISGWPIGWSTRSSK